MKQPFFRLTTKIVLGVAVMGLAFGMITSYATWHMQRIEQQHHQLLHEQARTGSQFAMLRQLLSDSSILVHASVVEQNEEQMLQAQKQLRQIQDAFESNLDAIYPLLPGHDLEIDGLLTQSRHMFAAGQRVFTTALGGQGKRSLQVLSQSFTPSLEKLHTSVNAVRLEAHNFLEAASHALADQTQRTISNTMQASWLSILLTSAWAAWMATWLISRPIGRLTQSMRRMRLQQYDTPIADQERTDEIGTMARALQSFGNSLQEASKLERELLEQQKNKQLTEQLQQLTSAIPGAVFQMHLYPDASLQLQFVSPQWVQLMGLPPDTDSSLENAARTIRNHDSQVTALAHKHYLSSARTLQPTDFEVSMQMLDGVTRWIKTRANPRRNPDGSTTFNGVWMDVTQEVMQSRALEKAKRQAEQSAAEKTTLHASISHEIRTPLNAILGLTQLLLKADLPIAQREQLHNVLRAGQHLRGIVNEVLDFSKIDAGQLKLESTDFSLENVVLDVLSMCHEEASKKGLTLNYKIAREVPDSLRGDPHRIAQILLNYVNNAIKFTTSGHIHIALKLEPHSTLHRVVLRATVTDTGPGIPADRIPLLFEAFQQADNSITRRFGGTGLGLTISRALAKLMGGSAGVDSVLGQGSSFWFTAVLEPARSAVQRTQPTVHAVHAPSQEWQGLRILVVDDNPLNRAVAEGMLHALGLQTEVAEDGAQALLKLQNVGPSYFACVLMDIQMPHMDGLSATQALRKIAGFENLPVIAMTAHTAVHDVERAQEAGMNDHLGKPLLESALHKSLQKWLGASVQQAQTAIKNTEPTAPASPDFDGSAIDALAQLFDTAKLLQLVQQFTHDTHQRAQQLPTLAQQHDWQAMRAETHKLSGTAATFGLIRLGQLSSKLSVALRASDSERATLLAQQVADAAHAGITQLQAYGPVSTPST